MTKTRKNMLIVLVTMLLMISVIAGAAVLVKTGSEANMDISYSLNKRLGDDYGEHIRLSQRVTVNNEEGTLPYSGTIIKSEDAFYPGTYKVTFSKNAILSQTVMVNVKFDVPQGETVYILTGNKDCGYSQYAVVKTKEDNSVEFETNILQNYTLSTTDICGAQEAMASLIGN